VKESLLQPKRTIATIVHEHEKPHRHDRETDDCDWHLTLQQREPPPRNHRHNGSEKQQEGVPEGVPGGGRARFRPKY